MSRWRRMRALAMTAACVVGVHGVAGAQVRGSATFAEHVRLPADAVFEASLVDVTGAGAPGAVVGRTRIERPGTPPIRFAIDYDPSRIEPRHVYMVRARVLVGSRQRFVANHSDLVLTWGNGRRVSLLLRRSNAPLAPESGDVATLDGSHREVSHGDVARDEVAPSASPPGESGGGERTRRESVGSGASSSTGAAIFTGNLPCADCAAVRHQLELFPNGSYFLRRAYLGKGRDAFIDDIGRWTLSRDGSTLTLKGSRDTTLRIAIGKPDTLHVLGAGKSTSSRSNTLALTDRAPPLEPRLEMRGMFTYMADAGRFTECSSRQSWPVAMEGDNAELESAYLRARRRDNEAMLVKVVGRVAMRPRMEGGARERALVVERFLDARPGERCAGGGATNAALENTYWKLTGLGDRPVTVRTGEQEPHLMLSSETGRMSGWAGCSGVSARYRSKGQSLTFTALMSMRATCAAKGSDLERRYVTALRHVSRAKITGQRLELFDARGKSLARFEAGRRSD
jgi:copper homeostasis protein (lipoprotein)